MRGVTESNVLVRRARRRPLYGLATAAAWTLAFVTAAGAGIDPAVRCEAGTNGQSGKYAACLAKAEKIAVLTGDMAAYEAAVAKCDGGAEAGWEKLTTAAAAKGASCPAGPSQMEGIGDLTASCNDAVADALAGTPLIQDPVACAATVDQCESDLASCDAAVDECENRSRAGLPSTRQTQCWNSAGTVIPCAGTGYDGETQTGTASVYADNGDGTITDTTTGLTWELLTDDGGIHDWNNSYNWTAAFAKVQTLNGAVFAGHDDWRLPNVRELQTLVDFGTSSPAIDPAFSATCSTGCSDCECTSTGYYWTSTTSTVGASTAMAVNFGAGVTLSSGKASSNAVRAVRGGS